MDDKFLMIRKFSHQAKIYEAAPCHDATVYCDLLLFFYCVIVKQSDGHYVCMSCQLRA